METNEFNMEFVRMVNRQFPGATVDQALNLLSFVHDNHTCPRPVAAASGSVADAYDRETKPFLSTAAQAEIKRRQRIAAIKQIRMDNAHIQMGLRDAKEYMEKKEAEWLRYGYFLDD